MRVKIRVLSLLLGMVAVFASAASAVDRPDFWITMKAKVALLTADNIDSTDIDVDTYNGRVTLHGAVANAGQKQRASALVRDVEGVRDVQNLLTVADSSGKPTKEPMKAEKAKASDDELRAQLQDAIEDGRDFEGVKVKVESVKGGVVVLEGRTETLSAKVRTLEFTRNYPGVKGVVDRIASPNEVHDDEIWGSSDEGRESSLFKDGWITTDVKMTLMANREVPALDVNVDTYDGVVVLFGIVGSERAKTEAGRVAKEVDGVREVKNQLQVVPDARKEAVQEKDESLEEHVAKALDVRAGLKDADIDVQVEKGVARLTGEIDSAQKRLEAATAARAVPGVVAVINDLRIHR